MSTSRRLLLIDDDEFHSRAIAPRLERHGFAVTTLSKNFDSALEVIQTERIEIVLLDLIMPDTSGQEILKKIRSRYERLALPVIILTGMNDSADVRETFDLGATDFITKPFSTDMVLARVKAHLAHVDLDQAMIAQRELEVLRAMVVTFCHEINNPLTVAMLEADKLTMLQDPKLEKSIPRLHRSLERIRAVIKKISNAKDSPQVYFDTYSELTKMIKIE